MENVIQGASGEDKGATELGKDEIIIVITEALKEEAEDDQTEADNSDVKHAGYEHDEVPAPGEDEPGGTEADPTVKGTTNGGSHEQTHANSELNTNQTQPICGSREEEGDQMDWGKFEHTTDEDTQEPLVFGQDQIPAKIQEELWEPEVALETVVEEGSDREDDGDDDEDADQEEIPRSLVEWDGPVQEEMDGTELADAEFEFTRWSGDDALNIQQTVGMAEDGPNQEQDDSDQLGGSKEQELKMVDRAIAGLETAEEYMEQETTFIPEMGARQVQADVKVILTKVDFAEENIEDDIEVSPDEGEQFDTWKRLHHSDKEKKTDTTGQVETESELTQEMGRDESYEVEVTQGTPREDVVIIVSTVEEVEPSAEEQEAEVYWGEGTAEQARDESKRLEEGGASGVGETEGGSQEVEGSRHVGMRYQQGTEEPENKAESQMAHQAETRENKGLTNEVCPEGKFSTAQIDTDFEKTRQDLEVLVSRAERAVPDLEKARQLMEQERVRADEISTELKLVKVELTQEKSRALEDRERAERTEATCAQIRRRMEEEKTKSDLLRQNLEQQKGRADRVEAELKKIQRNVESDKARFQGKRRIETEALEQARRDIEYEKLRAENAEAEMKRVQREMETTEERFYGQKRIEAETILQARRDAEYEKARANRLRLELRTLKENRQEGQDNVQQKDGQVQQLQAELEMVRRERDQEKAKADRLEADVSRLQGNTEEDSTTVIKLEQSLKAMKQEKARADRAETYFQQARRECEQEKVRAQLEKRRADRAEKTIEQKDKHIEQEKEKNSRAVAELQETKKQLEEEKRDDIKLDRTEAELKQTQVVTQNDTATTELRKVREQLEREKARADRAEEDALQAKETSMKHAAVIEAEKLKILERDSEMELERTREQVEQERARTGRLKEELEQTIKDFKMEKLRVQEEKIRADLAEAELRKVREKDSKTKLREELEKVWDETKAKAKVEARLSQSDLHLQLDSTTWDGYKLETSF